LKSFLTSFSSDPTGYSWHGDFQNGWEIDILQDAIDKCNNPNDETINGVIDACKVFALQERSEAADCKIEPVIDEVTGGDGVVLDRLPGYVLFDIRCN